MEVKVTRSLMAIGEDRESPPRLSGQCGEQLFPGGLGHRRLAVNVIDDASGGARGVADRGQAGDHWCAVDDEVGQSALRPPGGRRPRPDLAEPVIDPRAPPGSTTTS